MRMTRERTGCPGTSSVLSVVLYHAPTTTNTYPFSFGFFLGFLSLSFLGEFHQQDLQAEQQRGGSLVLLLAIHLCPQRLHS